MEETQFDKLLRVTKSREKEKEAAALSYEESSKRRLIRILEKKFQTTFIGCLSAFEEAFGYLWGHKKLETELTPAEKRAFAAWSEVRHRILNNGNNQLRAIKNELQQYKTTWERHQIKLVVKKEE